MVGVLLGYAFSNSPYAQPMYMKVIRLRPAQPTHSQNVLDACDFLKQFGSTAVQTWLPKVLLLALTKQEAVQIRAIKLAEMWGDTTIAPRLPKLYKKPDNSEVKDAILSYCNLVDSIHCRSIQGMHDTTDTPDANY